jgi:hypothetical protein
VDGLYKYNAKYNQFVASNRCASWLQHPSLDYCTKWNGDHFKNLHSRSSEISNSLDFFFERDWDSKSWVDNDGDETYFKRFWGF